MMRKPTQHLSPSAVTTFTVKRALLVLALQLLLSCFQHDIHSSSPHLFFAAAQGGCSIQKCNGASTEQSSLCQKLNDQIAPVNANDARCWAVQGSLKTACGCGGSTCRLCETVKPDKVIPDNLVLSLREATKDVLPHGFQWTCGLVDAYLQNFAEDAKPCTSGTKHNNEDLLNYCGCNGPAGEALFEEQTDDSSEEEQQDDSQSSGRGVGGTDNPESGSSSSSSKPNEPAYSCNLCANNAANTERSTIMDDSNIYVILPIAQHSFSVIETCAPLLDQAGMDEDRCHYAQQVGSLCGCQVDTATACQVCPSPDEALIHPAMEEVENLPSAMFPFPSARCDTLEAWVQSAFASSSDPMCSETAEFVRSVCGGCALRNDKKGIMGLRSFHRPGET